MEYSVAGGKLIHEKNQKQKISWHCPFKQMPNSKRNMGILMEPYAGAAYDPTYLIVDSEVQIPPHRWRMLMNPSLVIQN